MTSAGRRAQDEEAVRDEEVVRHQEPPLGRFDLLGRFERWAARSEVRVLGRNPLSLLARVASRFVAVRVTGLAAEMTYFMTLSVLPLITALGASLGMLQEFVGRDAVLEMEQALVGSLRLVLSEDLTADVVAPMVRALLRQERLGFALSSLALALFLASRVFRAAIRALDDAYRVDDRRNVLQQYALSLGFTLGAVLTMAALLTMVVVGPLLGVGQWLAEGVGAGSVWTWAWTYGRVPLVLLVAVAWLSWLYLVGPNVDNTVRECLPGALVGALGLLALTVGFRSYLAVAGPGGPGIEDGPAAVLAAAQFLAAALASLVYTWLASTLVLLGGVVNAEWAQRD